MRKTIFLDRLIRMVLVAVVLVFAENTLAQSFGKNKVQYKDFSWEYLQSKHFDVFYYGEGKSLAVFTADVAESSYVALNRDLKYDIHQRVPILIYNSHNDYEQTNVSAHLISETELGFTESFKNRVVIHFNGDYSAFRHLIHHELTHAVMWQMMYGGGVGSSLASMARFQLPLWVWEGMAEYESVGWDAESDMYLRDATINGYLPPVSSLYGWWAYKGGQALFNYISEKYGPQKVGEVINRFRIHRGVENGLKNTLGIDEEDLSKRWHKHMRKMYWPDIQDRLEPEDFAKRLTDHVKDKHFVNNAPAISPQGDKMVYLSNKSDYIDIFLMDLIEEKVIKKLVSGERSELFEELHWPRPGLDWSPDGRQIVFAAKAGSHDALYIMDVENSKIEQSYKLPMDGIFSPSWSPDGGRIAFMGLNAGQSDIYVLQLEDESLVKITDDVFSDLDPTWSPQGDEIAFVSDRGRYAKTQEGEFQILNHNYRQHDLYVISVESGEITRYTSDASNKQSPTFSPKGDKIAYVADREGITNIYMLDRTTTQSYPITNVLTGVSQIHWSREGSRLAFASFYNGGYDIYLISNPEDIEPGSITIKKTVYAKREEERGNQSVLAEEDVESPAGTSRSEDYRNFVFDDRFRSGKSVAGKEKKSNFLKKEEYKDEDGDYKRKKYKIRFTPDIVTGGAGYSQFFGLQGSSMIALSDILGNHQINIYADLFYSLKNSNFQLAYFFLPKRTDIGFSVFHFSYLYYTYYTDGVYLYPAYLRDRNYGLTFYASRPFDRYRRLDFGVTGLAIDRDYGEIPVEYFYYGGDPTENAENLYRRRMLLLNLGYKSDTVLWGMTGPVNGGRSNFSLNYSPSISQKYGLDYWTFRFDWRRYMRIKRDYTFVVRMAGGVSGGKQPQRFLLGGMMGWINYSYTDEIYDYWGEDLFYFSSLETPLRGYPYYEMIGTRFLLTNIEFRFPLVRYLILGWPLPIGFQNVRGAIFMDVGSAWSDDQSWRPFASSQELGLFRLDDMRAGFGFGARMNLGFFLLKYDVAWGTDFERTGKPVHYFTMGAEF